MKHKRPKSWYIRTIRKLRGPYSQTEFASSCEINQQTVSDYEAGNLTPRHATFRRMLDHYLTWTAKYSVQNERLVRDVLAYLTEEPPEEQDTPAPNTEA